MSIFGKKGSAARRRLPFYHRFFVSARNAGRKVVYAKEMSDALGLTYISNVCVDTKALVGSGGRMVGYGFNVTAMSNSLTSLLELDNGADILVVGPDSDFIMARLPAVNGWRVRSVDSLNGLGVDDMKADITIITAMQDPEKMTEAANHTGAVVNVSNESLGVLSVPIIDVFLVDAVVEARMAAIDAAAGEN